MINLDKNKLKQILNIAFVGGLGERANISFAKEGIELKEMPTLCLGVEALFKPSYFDEYKPEFLKETSNKLDMELSNKTNFLRDVNALHSFMVSIDVKKNEFILKGENELLYKNYNIPSPNRFPNIRESDYNVSFNMDISQLFNLVEGKQIVFKSNGNELAYKIMREDIRYFNKVELEWSKRGKTEIKLDLEYLKNLISLFSGEVNVRIRNDFGIIFIKEDKDYYLGGVLACMI
jgi:hypothetical protein